LPFTLDGRVGVISTAVLELDLDAAAFPFLPFTWWFSLSLS
jgi:hypothetical protein